MRYELNLTRNLDHPVDAGIGQPLRSICKNPPMPIIRLEHVQLAMPPGGENRAREFYSVALGIPELPKPPNLAKRGGCWFERGDLKIHLGVEADFRPALKAHPAFLVADLHALIEKVKSLGHAIREDEPLEGYRRVYVDDPFGNRVELMEASY
jgi:catechol 2,3-dioxygenase-like lactoylglutathione lyase family enzyme